MYKVICKYFKHTDELVAEGLTLDEAQDMCQDPETSSRTCTTLEGLERTEIYGPWFYAYTEE